MPALPSWFHLPLLAKELTEEAARHRTYWTRVTYGVLLFLIVGFGEGQFFKGTPNDPLRVLGEGGQLFRTLIDTQFAGIILFLPALMCGRITQEKERDSLVLLLLTDLRPWQIVLQKYLAGLVPMITFLLLGLPVAAVAFAFGGFPPRDIALAASILLFASLQLGALALWCSALFRTTLGAFLGTYLFGLIFYGGPIALIALDNLVWSPLFGSEPSHLLWTHIPPVSLELARSGRVPAFQAVAPLAATTLLFLGLAILHLPRRAFAPAAHRWRRLFTLLDRGARAANRLVGNVVLTRQTHSLPESEPVTWRERRVTVLGTPAHLVRLLMIIEVPVTLLAFYLSRHAPVFQEQFTLSMLGAVVGTFSVLVLAVTAANAFVSERVHQTLEVLLTTPLLGSEIVRQKARALRGLLLVLSVPLLTIFSYEALIEGTVSPRGWSVRQSPDHSSLLYVIGAVLTVIVYLPLVIWLGLWIGLKARTRLRAIVISLLVVIGWAVLPLIALGGIFEIEPQGAGSLLYLLSPLTVPIANEFHGLHEMVKDAPWLPVLINFTGYFIILHLIKAHCLRNADRWLRT